MKLGPHGILASTASIAWAQRAPIVKSLDVSLLMLAQRGATTIYRCYFDDEEQSALDVDYIIDIIMSRLRGYRPTFVELLNETHQRLAWGLAEYTAFVAECAGRFHAMGQMVAGFSFSTGQPEAEDWEFLAGFDPAFAGVDALAVHEYWGNEGLTTQNALRHRRVHDVLSGQHPPFIVTECGRDAVERGKGGWKLDGISGERYVGELLAYNAEIEKDDYVIGATPFTGGPTPDWKDFDTDGDCWRIPGGSPAQIRLWRPQGGKTMPWDRHQIFDQYEKALGGGGFNPNDAFGQFVTANPGIQTGEFIGPQLGYDRPDWDGRIVQYTTTGILVYVPGAGVTFATTEDQLPNS